MNLNTIHACIRQNLLDRRNHVARIIGGAACEQWFSSEAFAAINWPASPLLAAGHCGRAEDRKRDLVIRDGDAMAVATIESKVVHNNKNLKTKLADLHGQLTRKPYDDEEPECSRGGLIYAIWCDYFTRRDVKSENDFHTAMLAEVNRLFPTDKYRHVPTNGLDEIVPVTELAWPQKPYRVSLHMKFLERFCD